ncbi:MAG: hypothetical protein RL199_420 [Pseudomonadota bacterium]|jgi:uncharacterized protein (DUF1778 family)
MSRFQALTTTVLDDELEELRDALDLKPSQKAELLREVTALASWVVRQAAKGCVVEARAGEGRTEVLEHPTLERVRRRAAREPVRLVLDDAAVQRLSAVLDAPFVTQPSLQRALDRLSDEKRAAPKLRWPRTA